MRPLRGLVGLLALLLVHSLGCIGLQSNDARSFPRFPPEAIAGSERFELAVSVGANAVGVSADRAVRASLLDDVRSAYNFHLNQTGRIQGSGPNPPYVASVQVFDQGGDSGTVLAALVTGLTLYVIPSWSTHHYTTTVRLTDGAGNELGTQVYAHRLRLVQQLFLVFGMPFASLQDAYDRMWSEVMQDAAVWTVETLDAAQR
jgi:hypothetical protein